MKKRLTVILALTLVLCTVLPLASCGLVSAKKFERGSHTNTVYTNESLNLTFTLPAGMHFYSDKELADILNMTAEQMNDPDLLDKVDSGEVYEFMAVDNSNGSNIVMCVERVPASMGVPAYIEATKKSLAEQGGTQIVLEDKTGEAKLGGSTFTTVTGTSKVSGITMNQYYYFCKMGTTMVSFIFTDVTNKGAAWIEAQFAEVSADTQ